MGNIKTLIVCSCLIASLLISGCVGAPLVGGIILAGGLTAVVAVQTLNSAREQHPNVDFTKEYPETMTISHGYETTYDAVLKTIMELKEETETTDKVSGVINTKRVIFGEKPGSIKAFMGEKTFYQRKNILLKKLSPGKTEITVTVKFSQKGAMTSESEFSDRNAENVVRAVFFDALGKNLNSR